jgi:vacuolar-type H+-ATPase subunit E/Vma4
MINVENLKNQVDFLHEMEAKEIIEEAKERAEKIIKEAKERAEKIRSQKMKEKSKELDEKEERDLAKAKTDSKNKILNTKFGLFEETMTKAEEQLRKTVVNDKKYTESVFKLIVDATTKLSGTEFEILTNSRDKEFVSKNLKRIEDKVYSMKSKQARLRMGKETIETIGGAIVRTADKKQIFNNTLEARTVTFRNESGQKIFEMLFEGTEE